MLYFKNPGKIFFFYDWQFIIRYIGQDDDAELREKIENFQDDTNENNERKESALIKISNLSKKQEGIRNCFIFLGYS